MVDLIANVQGEWLKFGLVRDRFRLRVVPNLGERLTYELTRLPSESCVCTRVFLARLSLAVIRD